MTTPQDTEQYIRRAAVDAEGNRIEHHQGVP